VLAWEKEEGKRVRERVAAMTERELAVVEKRLVVEERELEAENDQKIPEDLRRLLD
jgi:hypothetical protein